MEECGAYLAAGRTLVGPPVDVPVVLETARVFEQLAALVTAVAARPAAPAQRLAHAVRQVLRARHRLQRTHHDVAEVAQPLVVF